jgi:hypothetical protein
MHRPPPLTVAQILAWADAHKARTGDWPRLKSGPVAGADGETWAAVDSALRHGFRGLHAGDSLTRLLARLRGQAQCLRRPPLTVKQVLAWARAHRRHAGRWPSGCSGPVAEAPGETWNAVNLALAQGHRGLPGCSSLAKLFAKRKRARKPKPPR